MNYDLAKRNRLKGKFNFKLKDWQLELDGLEEPLTRQERRRKLIWKRQRAAAKASEETGLLV